MFARGKVANAIQALAGDVAKEAPKVGLGILDLLTVAGEGLFLLAGMAANRLTPWTS